MKTTVSYYLTPVRMAIIKKTKITSASEDVTKELSCTINGNVHWYSHMENGMEVPQKIRNGSTI